MADVTIYTTRYCPYCTAALALLESRGIEFEQIDVTGDREARVRLIDQTDGRTTVPQIFIRGASVGGYDELEDLDRSGRLAEMLR
jgi:glutaredoxin 3